MATSLGVVVTVGRCFIAGLGVIALLLAGCVTTLPGEEVQIGDPRQLHAYGQTWRLVHTTRFDHRLWFFGAAVGGDEQPKDLLYLYLEDSTKIGLHERIFALQRDGSYKKVDCCSTYGGLEEPVFSVDEKLIFYMKARRQDVTDCHAYPPYAPDNEERPPEKQLSDTFFFGEFDPASKRVLLREFFPGAKERDDREKPVRTMREYQQFMYENRKPFTCD